MDNLTWGWRITFANLLCVCISVRVVGAVVFVKRLSLVRMQMSLVPVFQSEAETPAINRTLFIPFLPFKNLAYEKKKNISPIEC